MDVRVAHQRYTTSAYASKGDRGKRSIDEIEPSTPQMVPPRNHELEARGYPGQSARRFSTNALPPSRRSSEFITRVCTQSVSWSTAL